MQVDVGADVSLKGGAGGALNVGYNSESHKSMDTSSKVHKSAYYCFTYAAGMPPYLDWETTDEFMTEKDQLPTDASVFDRCTVSLFKKRSRSCDGVYRWMEFFDLFGTHITTEIHLGGRITRFLTAPTEAMDAFSKAGFNVDVALNAIISGALVDIQAGLDHSQQEALEKLNESCEVTFSVLGGIHVGKRITPKSLLKWKSTVPRYPMPIKMNVTPMDVFLGEEYEHAYREALNFYVTLSDALPWIVQKHNGVDLTARSLVMSASQHVVRGGQASEITLECSAHQKILFGFILAYDVDDHNVTVFICPSNSAKCSRENKDNNQAMIWALCGNSMGLQIMQQAKNFSAEEDTKAVTCNSGYTLLTGFSLVTSHKKKPHIKSFDPCRTGENGCHVSSKYASSIWGVCVDKRLPGLERATTLAIHTPSRKAVKLGENYLLLTGFRAHFGKEFEVSVCERYTTGCTLEKSPDASSVSIAWGIFRNSG